MPIPGRVMGGRRRDAVGGQVGRDAGVAGAGRELVEDASDGGRRRRLRLEAVEALADAGLLGVRVVPDLGQLVAVGRSPAEVPPILGLGSHGGPDSGADAVALPLAHAAEEGHDEVVRFRVGVDGTADLGNPEGDLVVHEEREGQAELAATERPLRFTDHHRVEAPPGIGEIGEEPGGLRASLPWKGPALPDVEVLDDDLAPVGMDEVGSPPELPGPARRGVLSVLGADSAVEREPSHRSRG